MVIITNAKAIDILVATARRCPSNLFHGKPRQTTGMGVSQGGPMATFPVSRFPCIRTLPHVGLPKKKRTGERAAGASVAAPA